jgi:hypothetical protein
MARKEQPRKKSQPPQTKEILQDNAQAAAAGF